MLTYAWTSPFAGRGRWLWSLQSSIVLESDRHRFKGWLCYYLGLWLWAYYLTSPNLNLVVGVGDTSNNYHRGLWRTLKAKSPDTVASTHLILEKYKFLPTLQNSSLAWISVCRKSVSGILMYRLEVTKSWVWILALPPPCWIFLGISFNLPVPSCPHLWK